MPNNETKYSKYTYIIDPNNITKPPTDIRDPMDKQFNWWRWCGFPNQEEITKACQEYNTYKSQLPRDFYKIFQRRNGREMDQLKNELLAAGRLGGEKDEYIIELFRTMGQWNRDILRTLCGAPHHFTITDRIYEICINVMFAIEADRLKVNFNNGYLQGEGFFFMQIVKMLLEDDGIGDEEIECLVFYISTTLYSKMTIKQTIYTIPPVDPPVDMIPNDRIPSGIFIEWLFMVMFIKKNKNKFKKLINNKNQKQVDDMFSESLSGMHWRTWIRLIGYLDTSVFREIIGNVLVSKDPVMYFAYMIAFFCGYKNTTGGQFDDQEPQQTITAGYDGFWDKNVYRFVPELARQSLTDINDDFNALYSYFKENFEKLVLMCTRKSYTNIKTISISSGTTKWHFKLPREFIKNREIWDINYTRPINEEKVAHITAIMRGGRKKIIKGKKYKTIKKYNRKLNRTIKLR
tara:strand:+ start:829 stop:2211 length:1383 start_codon:yes stop_codon:yes gene_type:complete